MSNRHRRKGDERIESGQQKQDRRPITIDPCGQLVNISSAIKTLTDEFIRFVKKFDSSNNTNAGKQDAYSTDQLKWTKRSFIASLGFGVATVILTVVTICVLIETRAVYQGQATIMATQAAISSEVAKDAENEFRITHEAHIFVDTDRMEFRDFGPSANVLIPIHNDGGSDAEQVVPFVREMLSPPDVELRYSQLKLPAGRVEPGLTINRGQTHTLFAQSMPQSQEEAIKSGRTGYRIIGRIEFIDEFGSHCAGFGAIYLHGVSRFEPLYVPPANIICSPMPTDGEIFTYDPRTSDLHVHFRLRKSENPWYLESPPPIAPTP